MRLQQFGSAFLTTSIVTAGLALGHGGTYTGPGDTVPPGGGGTSPGTPGPQFPATPQPGNPTGPGGARPGLPTGPGGTIPGAGGPGGVTGPMQSGPDLDAWQFWWELNKPRFLQIKSHIASSGGVITQGSGDDLLSGVQVRDSMRPSKSQLVSEVVPELLRAARTETNRDIRSACVVALAKIGECEDQVVPLFKGLLADPDQELAETAALSLGILGSPSAIPTLRDLYFDEPAGRALVINKKEVPYRTRTFAAYGLGLIGAASGEADVAREIQTCFLKFLDGPGQSRRTPRDLRVATVLSLGVVPDPDGVAVGSLWRFVENHLEKEKLVSSHIPTSIARLVRKSPPAIRQKTVEDLLALAKRTEERRAPDVRASVMQALGMITVLSDPFAKTVVAELQTRVTSETAKAPVVSHFSIMALGEISGTGAPGNELDRFLMERASQMGGRVASRAWAALALGVSGFYQAASKARVEGHPAIPVLSDMLQNIKNPEQQAAYAVGLGLLGAKEAAQPILACLDRVKTDSVRGYFATALGLMDYREATPRLQELVRTSTRRPEVMRECAMALGLLSDKSVVPTLTDLLKNPENQTLAVQAAIAMALGFVGDRRSVAPLVAALRDEGKQLAAVSRAFSAVALGIVGDKEDLPWNAKFGENVNYLAAVETLTDAANAAGILNLL